MKGFVLLVVRKGPAKHPLIRLLLCIKDNENVIQRMTANVASRETAIGLLNHCHHSQNYWEPFESRSGAPAANDKDARLIVPLSVLGGRGGPTTTYHFSAKNLHVELLALRVAL